MEKFSPSLTPKFTKTKRKNSLLSSSANIFHEYMLSQQFVINHLWIFDRCLKLQGQHCVVRAICVPNVVERDTRIIRLNYYKSRHIRILLHFDKISFLFCTPPSCFRKNKWKYNMHKVILWHVGDSKWITTLVRLPP